METCVIGKTEIGGNAPVRLMGVINCSPESFFSGSYIKPTDTLNQALNRVEQGADLIDVGARSTAPNAPYIPVSEETTRITEALKQLEGSGIPVSVDTMYPEVLDACLRYDIAAVNDINGLANPAFARLLGDSGLPAILMASNRQPGDPVGTEAVMQTLGVVIERANNHRIKDVILDPAIGYWTDERTAETDWELCRTFSRFQEFGKPVLAAISRKSFIGDLLKKSADQRLAGSLAVTYSLLEQGAAIVRTHDIAETKDIITIYQKIKGIL